MDDKRIVSLFWDRSESAISETQRKYGAYCHTVAYRILESHEDSEECVNDTFLKAWNAIPPHKPEKLSAFLGKITRNLALDRYEKKWAQKRGGQVELALEELAECLPSPDSTAPMSEELILKEAINAFLASLPQTTRIIFMRRYWYLCSVREIAESFSMTESNVKVLLMRTRNKMKIYLEQKGVQL
ncbi:MAG: sigma-70 family RNA polymerase sigma factor [Clostridia bacterium]|nr:sigma-70 family RNA polymerase sigma factor [Clostridia bacterium]